MHSVEITSSNGGVIGAMVYEGNRANGVLVIAGAMGTKQTFYSKFAEFISAKAITVITFDYTGIGCSLTKPVSKVNADMKLWGSNDLESVLHYVHLRYNYLKLFILGHSAGGQLIGLAPSSLRASQILLVSAQSGYWKFWKGYSKYKMWAYWHILFPSLVYLFGYLPSKKISGMENLPAGVALQWRNWCISPNYLFDDIRTGELLFEQITCSIYAFSCTDDIFAPKAAVDWLAAAYKNAQVESIHLNPALLRRDKIGHFGFFKVESEKDIWELFYTKLANETVVDMKTATATIDI